MTAWPGLTQEHTDHLVSSALTPEIAEKHGIRSITRVEDLPEEFSHYGSSVLPAILFPWTQPDGTRINQLKVPDGFKLPNGDRPKYLWAKGQAAELGEIRREDRAETILIVEGTKQSRAADAWAPLRYAVYGIAGCRMWSRDGVPTEHLSVADGRKVVVILDADAATNPDVYDAGEALQKALSYEGATDVRFVQLPGSKKSGLDDILAKRDESRRTSYLENLITHAASKPAERKPKPKTESQRRVDETRERLSEVETLRDGRKQVLHPGDDLDFARTCLEIFKESGDGTKFFYFAGKLSERREDGMVHMDKEYIRWPLLEAIKPVTISKSGDLVEKPFSSVDCDMILSKGYEFAPLDKLSSVPFVRNDGSICQTPGYDAVSKTYLDLSEEFDNFSVPQDPTDAEVREAVRLLNDELLCDFPFSTPSDKTNAIALLLTPFVRGMLPLVPMAVVDGRDPGVGKGLLANVISLIVSGHPNEAQTFPKDGEEMRKQITSIFRSGSEFVCFDEARSLSSEYLAQALTATTWRDRTLGKSDSVGYPNKVTWVSLGNQVEIGGDLGRRVYRINLAYNGENPSLRPKDYYRHPDLPGWVVNNRAKLVRACLVLIRNWFAKGRPASDTQNLGSFEQWVETLGGILNAAGLPDFMENTHEWRSESNFDRQLWVAHLDWLRREFGAEVFTTAGAKKRMQAPRNTTEVEAPPNLSDTSLPNYSQTLGRAYFSHKDRIMGGFQLVKVGTVHGNMAGWRVNIFGEENGFAVATGGPPPEDDTPSSDGPQLPDEPVDLPDTEEPIDEEQNEMEEPSVDEQLEGLSEIGVVFDIETAGNDIHGYGDGFVRLCGFEDETGQPVTTPDAAELVSALQRADKIIGHNILGFDIPALAKYTDLDYAEAAAKAADTMIYARQIDPPPAKGTKPGYYSLDSLARRLGVAGKTDDLKALASKWGGFDKIPVDDPEYNEYLRGDLAASRAVYEALDKKLSDSDRAYVEREHRVMARFGRASLEGFRVDTELLKERIATGEARKKANLELLNKEFGVPLGKWKKFKTKPDEWHEHKSPLATAEGKEALEKAFRRLGAPHFPRTPKSNDISTNKDEMEYFVECYSDPDWLKKNKVRPSSVDVEGVARLAELVVNVTSERTVYKTIWDHLVGDRVFPKVVPSQASGRWSVTDPGLTVLGKREGRYVEREVFLPEDGHVLVAVDLDQVDARAIAWHSGDEAYQALFAPGKDLHSEVAEMVFGRSDGVWRDRAKILGHGFNYGLGPSGAAKQTGIPLDVAQQFHQNMTERFPVLAEWKDKVRQQAKDGELLDNGFGRKMRPDRERYYTQGPALPGQGATRDILAEGILRLPEHVVPMLRVVIHDEAVFSVPENRFEEIKADILDAMQFDLGPLRITAGSSKPGKNWGEVYEK